jgi:prepilin-type N-terminal cleavage/methylation domain-containing protein
MSRSPNTSAAMRRAALGFTLIELLVVMIIIAVIIAIVLPALGLARKAARTSTTKAMMTNITNAAGTFGHDNQGRMPGYFTPRQMADNTNLTEGFTGMQNLMLGLAGGIVSTDGCTPPPPPYDTDPEVILVGPGSSCAGKVWVHKGLLGSGALNSKTYFTPDAKHFASQTQTGQQVSSGAPANATYPFPANTVLPSVVDDFSNPLLAWVIDETAVGQIKNVSDFAKDKLTGANAPSARFYWASNAAFLSATALGKRGYDQTDQARGSWIGSTSTTSAMPPIDVDKSLCGFLGSPSFPYRAPGATAAPTVPAAARAPLVLHSAGADGIFLGRKDRGSTQFPSQYVDYQMSFVNRAGSPEQQAFFYTDKDGKREIIDLTKAYDDILATGGN